MISSSVLNRFIEQSNLIEGITRAPTPAEEDAHEHFLSLEKVTIPDLVEFVLVVAPGKPLRDRPGLNVYVGNHVPPPGGPDIPVQLQSILDMANAGMDSWLVHCNYEDLHPFCDGNGRSGRVLWLWQEQYRPLPPGLFMHRFYYQTLSNFRGE